MPDTLPSGEISFAASERVAQQVQRQREEEQSQLALVKQLELTRDSLLEEVSYLSSRNVELEERVAATEELQVELNESAVRTDTLLGLLGEKEEEVESVLSDMKDMRDLYKHHIEELSLKVLGDVVGDSKPAP